MTLKKILRYIVTIGLMSYGSYCVYYVLSNNAHPEYKDCGVVKSKSNDEVSIKHGSRTELYLNVEFEKTGFKSVLVDPTTYFKNDVGDYVCFNLDEKVNYWHRINYLAGLAIMIVGGILSVAMLFIYIFSEDKI